VAELDFVAQHWEDADWHLARDHMLDEPADSWVRILGRWPSWNVRQSLREIAFAAAFSAATMPPTRSGS
jgi:hypothetical protein